MSGTTWSKFYWADWESDERLKMCSPGAQALWMRMLCVCAKAEGYLMIAGKRLNADDMAILTGWSQDDVRKWWAELARWEVFSVEGRGKVFSRKMVKDLRKADIARENGKGGGNPNLRKDTTSPPSDNQNPTDHPTNDPGKNPSARSQRLSDVPDGTSSPERRPKPKASRSAWFDALVERLWRQQPVTGGKRKATRPEVAKALGSALDRGGAPEEIEAAFGAYYALPDCVRDEGRYAKGAAVLLHDDKWRDFVPSTPVAPPPSTWAGPPEIRSAIVTAKGEDWTRSFLDPCGCRPDQRVVFSDNDFRITRLIREAGDILSAHGWKALLERAA